MALFTGCSCSLWRTPKPLCLSLVDCKVWLSFRSGNRTEAWTWHCAYENDDANRTKAYGSDKLGNRATADSPFAYLSTYLQLQTESLNTLRYVKGTWEVQNALYQCIISLRHFCLLARHSS